MSEILNAVYVIVAVVLLFGAAVFVHEFGHFWMARRAGEVGGTMPAVLNAANEVAVEAFCNCRISFEQISQTVASVMERHQWVAHPSLDEILSADAWARAQAAG